MKMRLLCLLLLMSYSLCSSAQEAVITEVAKITDEKSHQDVANLLSKKAGAKFHSCNFTPDTTFSPENIIDDKIGKSAVCRMPNKKDGKPNWIVFELPETKHLTTFSVNTSDTNEAGFVGITAHRVAFYGSNESATEGYQLITNEFLARNKDEQIISIAATNVRWLKIEFQNNWNHPNFTEIGRIYAYNDVILNEYELILQAEGKLDVSDIHFEIGSHLLMQKSLPIIETIAELLATHPEWNLTVEGHTDNSGSKETNLELSRKRAETVTNLLVKMGIDRSRLKYTGYGASQPLTTESSREAMAANRRVTFRLN